jgi:hypothetical protein
MRNRKLLNIDIWKENIYNMSWKSWADQGYLAKNQGSKNVQQNSPAITNIPIFSNHQLMLDPIGPRLVRSGSLKFSNPDRDCKNLAIPIGIPDFSDRHFMVHQNVVFVDIELTIVLWGHHVPHDETHRNFCEDKCNCQTKWHSNDCHYLLSELPPL